MVLLFSFPTALYGSLTSPCLGRVSASFRGFTFRGEAVEPGSHGASLGSGQPASTMTAAARAMGCCTTAGATRLGRCRWRQRSPVVPATLQRPPRVACTATGAGPRWSDLLITRDQNQRR